MYQFGMYMKPFFCYPVLGMGSTEETSGGSCKEIKEKCRGVKSGKFWIQLTSGTNKLCYCDMETKGGMVCHNLVTWYSPGV